MLKKKLFKSFCKLIEQHLPYKSFVQQVQTSYTHERYLKVIYTRIIGQGGGGRSSLSI